MTQKDREREVEVRRGRRRQTGAAPREGSARGPRRETRSHWQGSQTAGGKFGRRRMEKEKDDTVRREREREERREKYSKKKGGDGMRKRGNTQKPEEAPNMGTWKTNLRYSGNWGHWNL